MYTLDKSAYFESTNSPDPRPTSGVRRGGWKLGYDTGATLAASELGHWQNCRVPAKRCPPAGGTAARTDALLLGGAGLGRPGWPTNVTVTLRSRVSETPEHDRDCPQGSHVPLRLLRHGRLP